MLALKCQKILKCLILAAFMIFICHNPVYAQNDISSPQYIIQKNLGKGEVEQVERIVDDVLNEADVHGFSAEDILNSALRGSPMENLKGIPKLVLNLLGREIRANLTLIVRLYAIILLGAVIRCLQPFRSGIPNEAAKLAVNGIIILTASVSFGTVAEIAANTIGSLQNIASVAMPALVALMAASGQIVSIGAIQPVMLICVNIACQIFKNVLLPLTIMAALLFLVDSVCERFRLKNLADLFKSCTVWITAALTLTFSLLISVQRIAGSSVDAVTLKTTRFAIGSFVPVAGKYMADAAETIMQCAFAVRNAAGLLTIIGLVIICLVPFIKVIVIMFALKLTAAIGAPVCDEAVCDGLEEATGCLSVVLGIMCSSLFVLVLLTGSLMTLSGFLG